MLIALIIVGKTTAIYNEGVLGQQLLVLSPSTVDGETKQDQAFVSFFMLSPYA